MTLENSRVLHKHFLELGDKVHAEQQEKRYPELKQASTDPCEEPPKPKEVKKIGKKSKR